MTDNGIEPAVAQPRGNRLTRRLRGFATRFARTPMGRWLAAKTARWQTIIAILVMASGFPLVIGSIGAINAHNRASDLREVSHALYFANVVDHSQNVAAYQLCLDGVARSDANRQQWMALADIVVQLAPGNERAVSLAQQIRSGPLLSAKPRTVDDCPDPGPAPVPPSP